MPLDVYLYPGFPLPAHDYSQLSAALAHSTGPHSAVVVGHSLGALSALSDTTRAPIFLLAPSIPGRRRPGRSLMRRALRVLDVTPISAVIAHRLRTSTYWRYRATPPTGDPLTLDEAADRLRAPEPVLRHPPTQVFVICSKSDPRHEAQLRLARQLGARVQWTEGGHLFPITDGRATADIILNALA